MEKAFGKHLQQLRTISDYTQKEMAERLYMTPSGYASWEQGVSEPSMETIKRLIVILDVSYEELFDYS